MDIVSSRRVKQVMAKLGINPVNKAGMILKVSIYRYELLEKFILKMPTYR